MRAAVILVEGAFGRGQGIAYTLFYATNFIFTGLAVAVAMHAGLFNIGGEGQAYVAGLGVGLVCLALDRVVPWFVTFPFAIAGAALRRGLGLYPGLSASQARLTHRHHHDHVQHDRGEPDDLHVARRAETGGDAGGQDTHVRSGRPIAPAELDHRTVRRQIRSAPFNVSFLLALVMAYLVWLLIWRTKLGYEIRTFGFSQKAARYAGISEVRVTIIAMLISGALAGMMSINAIMGDQHSVYVDLAGGAGFIGIAVALMGRAHPVGIILASILFGMLYQGGAELSFEMPAISRDMIVIIQGLVILFAGALEHMFRPYIQTLFASFSPKSVGMAAVKGEGA